MWFVTTLGKTGHETIAVLKTLEDAIAWCEFDNFGLPLRWLVDNDALRSLGPYLGGNNGRGYTVAVTTWDR
jgi:hypothetical protein